MGRYFSTNHGIDEALEQDPQRCLPSRDKAILDAGLEHTLAFLQVCRQHAAVGKIYVSQSGGRVFVISMVYPRQRLHSNFENASWNEKKEKGPEDTGAESLPAGYFAIVSGSTEITLRICKGSHPSGRAIPKSRVKELGLVSVFGLVKVLPYSVVVINENTFHAGPAWTDTAKG